MPDTVMSAFGTAGIAGSRPQADGKAVIIPHLLFERRHPLGDDAGVEVRVLRVHEVTHFRK